ncbi:MAG: ABC transporter ATP-binding protein [Bryobacteraceae bacterium]|nr:ABC transporter ATP-binding protein [Bryobacteraceae bacterium]
MYIEHTGPVFRTLRLLAARRRASLLLLALAAGAAGLEICVPFITQRLIDQLTPLLGHAGGRERMGFTLAASALGILAAVSGMRALRSLYNYKLFQTATSIEDEIKCVAFENYLRLHALYHREANSGQVIGRIDRGATAVFAIVHDIFGQSLLPPLITLSLVLASLLGKSGWVALAVFLPVPLYVLLVRRLTGRISSVEQQVSADFEAVAKESYDIASNVLTVKKFSRENDEVKLQRRLLGKARNTQYGAERLWAVIENLQTFVTTLGRVAVIVIAGYQVMNGRNTVGEFVLFVALTEMAYQPVSQLAVVFPRLRRNSARAERLYAVVDERPRIVDRPGAVRLSGLAHTVEFRDVWFRYSEDGPWILRGVNFTVAAGSTVALVGRSGSGKTTFVNLLMRSYDPQHGQILIDGHDLRDVAQESLYRLVSAVPQEVDLFSRTIAENIAYGKPGASQAEIEWAAKLALAHNFVERAEDGYATVVGERGLRLSGGERQRLGIARAILRDPAVLVLDEATSHLDTESEKLIQQATEQVVRGRTAFVIAHRLSTVLHADVIAVFEGGVIEAAGRHEELLETSATYRTLYELHSSGAAPRAAAAAA